MDPDVASARYKSARDYLLTETNPPWGTDWQLGYAMYQAGDLSTPQQLFLCNPMWYPITDFDAVQERIQGVRPFSAHRGLETCRSDELYGYECPVTLADPVHCEHDHLFPYSLGGPTDPRNRISLCTWHNREKGSGIHVFKWELGAPPWVPEAVERISRALAESN